MSETRDAGTDSLREVHRKTTWTHDLPPGDLAAPLGRLRSCDGKQSDAAVVVWEQCQALVAEVDHLLGVIATQEAINEALAARAITAEAEVGRLAGEADLYRRGYEAMGAADISEYLALCGSAREVERLRDALEQIEQVGHNPADLAPDLHPAELGVSDAEARWRLSQRLADMAMAALNGRRPEANG